MRSPHALAVAALAALPLAVAGAQDGDPLRQRYARAQELQRAGELERAEQEYTREVLPRALRRLGNLSGAEGRVDEAIALLDEARTLDPDNIDIRVDLAIAWLRKPDLARARAIADEAAAHAVHHPRVRAARGRIRLLQGDAAGAAEDLRAAYAVDPRVDTAFALALASLHLKRLDAARALFDPMLVSGAAEMRTLVGRAYLEAGLPEEAARYPDAAVPPSRPVVLDMLPMAAASTPSPMRVQLEEVIATARHNLAVIGSRRRADIPRTGTGTSTEPPAAQSALRARAEGAVRAADLDTALSAARELVAMAPSDVDARYLLGIVLLQRQEWDQAVEIFRDPPPAAARNPRWPAALGAAEYGRRNYEGAQQAFDRTLELDPGHIEARFHLGLIAVEQGRTAPGQTQLESVLAAAPGHAGAHAALGALHLTAGRVDRARLHLERAIALDPSAPAPHYQLGLLFARIGDAERARNAMKEFERLRHSALAATRHGVIKQPPN